MDVDAWLADKFPKASVEVGPPDSNVEGEPYVTLTSAGLKAEGQPVPAYFGGEEDAWDEYFSTLKAFLERREAPVTRIVWRRVPEIRSWNNAGYYVTSRLAVFV